MDRTQMILLGFATLVVGYQAIKGWRLGLVRQIVRFGALAAAYVAGYFWSSITVPFLRPLGYPDFILHAIGGAAQVLAECIKKVNNVYFLEKFGSPEAIWELAVVDFPAVVTMDAHGRSLHEEVFAKSQTALAERL